jgi:hypothetical protein
MNRKNTQRKQKHDLPVLWEQEELFEVVPAARLPDGQRPWQQCSLFIHLSEGDTTRVVRQAPGL